MGNAQDPEKLEPVATDSSDTVPQRGSIGDIRMGNDATYNTTKRGLKSRHAQMIALGGTIGTG